MTDTGDCELIMAACAGGYRFNGTICVPMCGDGFTYSPVTRDCVPMCRPSQSWNGVKCVDRCPSGECFGCRWYVCFGSPVFVTCGMRCQERHRCPLVVVNCLKLGVEADICLMVARV
jgi:hypothetical protein